MLNIIALVFSFEVGLIPFDNTIMYQAPPRSYEEIVFYTTLTAEVRLLNNHAFIGGSTEIREWKDEKAMAFWPERAGFEFNAGIRFGPVEIGFRHYCTHPIIPFNPTSHPDVVWEGGYEKIYIRVEGSK